MNIIEGIVLIIGIICATLLGLSYILKDEINKKIRWIVWIMYFISKK